MKRLSWSFSVALVGFLFGFDTIVISGADQILQEIWQSSDVFHGFVVMGMALWGTVLGAILGGLPTNKLGRKNTLIGIGLLFFVSALGSALVNDPYAFSFFRFIGGLGIGISTIAAPAYITEIASANRRGQLVAMYQLSIVMGILIAMLSNFLLRDFGENAWRWMMGVEAIPALIYTLIVLTVPKSPRWLLMKGKVDEAKALLQVIAPEFDFNALVNRIDSEPKSTSESIFSRKYKTVLLLVFSIAFFNQFSGINALLYYAPRIFEEAGLGRSSALLSGVGIGLVNVIFTIVGMGLIDRLGRKRLMYIGSFGYIVSLSLVAFSFLFDWDGFIVPILLFVFIASHAIGQGTVIWVFIAELFPTHLRALGQAFGSSIHWILAAFIPSFIPISFSTVGAASVFGFFALMMLMQLIWVYLKMPETKGVSLEELSKRLSNN